jgi:hypothetical protein
MVAKFKRLYGRLIIIAAKVEDDKLSPPPRNVTCNWITQWLSPNVLFTSVLKIFYSVALNVSSTMTIFQLTYMNSAVRCETLSTIVLSTETRC